MSSYKKWISSSLILVLSTLACIGSINFYVDSYWSFNHDHIFNKYQRGNRERQQKSNTLYFRDKQYDTIIFGSSRTAYMDQHTWSDTTFNYAASDMQPSEYTHYLNFALNTAKQPIKRVIIGLDFFGALEYESPVSSQSESILSVITTPVYRYKLLLSIDALDYSMKNIKYYFTQAGAKYNDINVKSSIQNIDITKEQYSQNNRGSLEGYKRDRYSHSYDLSYKNTLKKLVKDYPNIEFIVFTTPVNREHFESIQSLSKYNMYERWLRESVEVFDKVNHFMYKNELTNNAHLYFQDSNHAYNTTYDCLTNEILGKDSSCPKTNMILSLENIDEKLNLLKTLNQLN